MTELHTDQTQRSATAPTAAAVFDQIQEEALRHPALRHPWLQRIRDGKFADMSGVLRNYARHYYGYSAWFPRYLRAVISRLQDPDHRELLTHNLEEEQGVLHDEEKQELAALGIALESVDGVPHPELFRRFCIAVGCTETELAAPTRAATKWRETFVAFLTVASPAAAVGALGLGTESVVKPIYHDLLAGIRRLGLPREAYVFFELHSLVDDQHAIDLQNVAKDLIVTDEDRADLREGMLWALSLRNEFWNQLSAESEGSRAVTA